MRMRYASQRMAVTSPSDYRALLEFSSEREASALRLLADGASVADVARELGITDSGVRKCVRRARLRAAKRGWAPEHGMTHVAPPGFHIKGTSTYHTETRQWVKTQKDKESRIEDLLEAFEMASERFKGQSKAVPATLSRYVDEDLLAVYPMGDPHIGMFSWPEETGQAFDLKIAEQHLVQAVDHLVDLAPPAKQALIINLGDFYHTDLKENRTLRSANALDVDTRWAKVLAVGIRIMQRCIDQSLTKHTRVRVINEIGNHDDHSAVMLSLCLANYYNNNPRVEVDTGPAPYHWHRFGKTLIGVTHGDKCKIDQLPTIMAADRKEDWGETDHRYWYTGHVHHDSLKEFRGCTVETFRTLAARDAWHHGAGYRSGRDMKLDVIHREFGKVNRHIIGIGQLEKLLLAKAD